MPREIPNFGIAERGKYRIKMQITTVRNVMLREDSLSNIRDIVVMAGSQS